MVDIRGMFTRALQRSRPWDSIIDFATHPSFCGNRLYPRQETLLKLIYLELDNFTQYDQDVIGEWEKGFAASSYPIGIPPGTLDRARRLRDEGAGHFRQVIAVMGRRAGKGHLGGIILAERLARLVALDNPQDYYGFQAGHMVTELVAATTFSQAKLYLFSDLVTQVKHCKWLTPYLVNVADHEIVIATPADMRAEAANARRGLIQRKRQGSIYAAPASSNSAASRGGSVYAAGFDEFAFTRPGESNQGGAALYDAIMPALDQFGRDSIAYFPSSPYARDGKFWELYQQAQLPAGDPAHMPDTLACQFESWGLYEDWEDAPRLLAVGDVPGPEFAGPIQVAPDPDGDVQARAMAALEAADPVAFRVERRGQFVASQYGFLREEIVDRMFDPGLSFQDAGRPAFAYHLHCDPAKTGADFAAMLAHVEQVDGEDTMIVDNYWVWPVDTGTGEVDYRKVIADIKGIMRQYPTLASITFDQFNSILPLQELRAYARQRGQRTRVGEQTFTAGFNKEMYSALRTALGLGIVRSPVDDMGPDGGSLLRRELLGLEEVHGKVVKSDRAKDDLVDCLGVLVVQLLGEGVKTWRAVTDGAALGSMSLAPQGFAALQQRGAQRGSPFAGRLSTLPRA